MERSQKENEVEQSGDEQYLFTDRKWILALGGYVNFGSTKITRIISRLYQQVLARIILLTMIVSFSTGAILSMDDKNDLILSLHFAMTSTTFFLSHAARSLTEVEFDEAARNLRSGLFAYDGEGIHQRMAEIQAGGMENMRRNLNMFSVLVACCTLLFSFVRPIFINLFIQTDDREKAVNPYVSLPLYMPFDTTSAGGFALASFIGSVISTLTMLFVLCVEEMYIGATSCLKTELQLLNHSVRCIRERAFSRLEKNVNLSSNLFDRSDFQNSLYACLKENVRHHQAILRVYKKLSKSYVGRMLLVIATMASGTLAVVGLAILQSLKSGDGLFVLLSYVGLITLETAFAFRFCSFGEGITKESEELFDLLYSSPWPNCTQRYRTILLIMMCNTRSPIRVRTPIFSFTASYESFGQIISTMYQLLNLARKTTE